MFTKNIQKPIQLLKRNVHKFTVSGQHVLNIKQEPNNTYFQNAKSFNQIPGPKSYPVFGYLWNMFPVVGKYGGMPEHEVHIRLNKEYGNLVRLRDLKFRNDLVLCFDPKDIETIFRTEGPWPLRDILNSIRHYRVELRKDIYQGYGGVFTSDGKQWQDARSMVNPILMQPRSVKHYIKPMSIIADDFIERVHYLAQKDPNNEMPTDFINELNKWALESVGNFAFDTRLGLLNGDLDPASEQQLIINDILTFFNLLYEIDVLPSLAKYMNTPKWKKYIALLDRITTYLQKQLDVTEAKIKTENNPDKPPNEMSAVEKLLKIDRKYAFGNAMDILLGGVETTSRTMSAILYILATHPEQQEILRNEIFNILPSRTTELTSEKLEEMPYLRAVIKECMRLVPIGLGMARKTRNDIVLSGYQIPKGTDLIIEQIPLFWSEKYFQDARKFKPERFLRTSKEKPNPWIYLPFGFGPRACVGRRLAQLEIETMLSKLIRNFRLEWHHEEMKYKMALFYGVDSPLKIRTIPLN